MKMKLIIKNIQYAVWIPFIIMVITLSTFLPACKKLIEVDPPIDKVTGSFVFNNDANAIAVLTGTYINMSNDENFVSSYMNLSSDELILHYVLSQESLTIYTNSMLSSLNYGIWSYCYDNIFRLNGAIEGINSSNLISAAIKKQLLGEAKFTRAFLYFYLTNLYGNVPYITSTDYKVNSLVSRLPVAEVYQNIINDLKEAQHLLNTEFVGSDVITTTTERVRPSKWAATALLARVYLYREDWSNAELQATAVINENVKFNLLPDLNTVFLKNSEEAIWQLAPANLLNGYLQTQEARYYYLTSTPNDESPVSLSDTLYNTFEPADKRKEFWTGTFIDSENPGSEYHFAYKYKVKTGDEVPEYAMVFRLAEQYLIRAEARVHQGKTSGVNSAVSDINIIRERAGLQEINATSSSDILLAIESERQHELFTEWGHRWLDLKRTNRADIVMPSITILKGGTWETTDQLYPVPQKDLQNNPNLNPQNPGY